MSNTEIVRAMLDAYRAGDHGTADDLLAADLLFTSPQDDGIDKRAVRGGRIAEIQVYFGGRVRS